MVQESKTINEDIPPRFAAPDFDPTIGIDLNNQPKWNIPDKIAISCCVVGGTLMRARNPNQPYTPDEIRNEAINCIEAGATSLHLHVRDDDGHGFIQNINELVRKMHQVVDPIREKYGWNVVIDGSECTRPTFEDEKILIDEGLSEIAPLNPAFSERKLLQAEAYYLQKHGVKPAIAIYNDGDISKAKEWLIDTGIIQTRPLFFGLLPGFGVGSTPIPNELYMAEYLVGMIRRIRDFDPNAYISVPSSGRASSYLATMAIILGLHLRIGLEDTYFLWPHKDDIIPNNVRVFVDMKNISEILGRQLATANELRVLGGIPEK